MPRSKMHTRGRLERFERMESKRQTHPRINPQAYRLKSLLLVVSIICMLLAILTMLGPEFVERLSDRSEGTVSSIPEATITETLVPGTVMVSMILAPLLAWGIYRMGSLRGFIVFCIFVCLSLVCLVSALALDIPALSDTQLKQMSKLQGLYVGLLAAASLLPSCSFVGWYVSVALNRNK